MAHDQGCHGRIALGTDGGGIAQFGVAGRGAKAWGCTGLPTPVGDLFAVVPKLTEEIRRRKGS